MKPVSCIVIDDEPLARKGLKEYISDVEYLFFAGAYESPLKAVEVIREGSVELIFLDIQMPRLSGIEFLRTLKQPPPVIFTTAFPQHANTQQQKCITFEQDADPFRIPVLIIPFQ